MWSFSTLGCSVIRFLIIGICILAGESRNHLQNSKKQFLGGKFQRVLKLSQDQALIEGIKSDDFQLLVIDEPRNYSSFVLFTTRMDYCGDECHQATRNLGFVSKFNKIMVTRTRTSPRAFFFEILEESEPDILRMVGIGPINLPTLFYFPSQGRLENLKELDVDKYTLGNIESILEWIFSVSNIDIDVDPKRELKIWEIDLFLRILSPLLFVVNFVKYRELIFYLLIKKTANCFGVMSIFTVCFCSSGQIFNGIRYTPFIGESSSGSYHFMHPSTSSQFGGESFVIMLLYCGITAAIICLIEGRTEALYSSNHNSGIILTIFGSLLILFCFTSLHNMYVRKLGAEQ